jgi:hypothetical protein
MLGSGQKSWPSTAKSKDKSISRYNLRRSHIELDTTSIITQQTSCVLQKPT